jgi:oligopeptide transport system permease protein
MHSIPGGPFTREKALPPAVIEALNKKYHLDDPLYKQYIDYLLGVARFDFGPSFQKIGVDTSDLILKAFPYSAKIGGVAALVVLLIGIPLGILSAIKHNTIIDRAVMVFATLGVTIPSFVVATGIIYFFSAKLGWLPSFGLKSWLHYIGPCTALAGFSMAFIARLTRSSMLEVMQQDYIRTARAKGLSEFVVVGKHAFKNALIPVITYIGPMLSGILTGSFVIERIFAIPGMGKFFVESVGNRDYTLLMAITIFDAAILVGLVFIVDLLYGVIDPRIKLTE